MPVKIGCGGFPVARNRYFEAFERVEVQQTFYGPEDKAPHEMEEGSARRVRIHHKGVAGGPSHA